MMMMIDELAFSGTRSQKDLHVRDSTPARLAKLA